MRLVFVSLAAICAIATTVSTNSISDSTDLDAIPYNITRRRVQRRTDTEAALKNGSTVESGQNRSDYDGTPLKTGERLMTIPTTPTSDVIVKEEPISSKVKTLVIFLSICVGGVAVGMISIFLCCCWIEKRRLRRLAIEESDRPEEMVHPVSRPLILENNGCADVPFDPPSPGIRPVIERVLPDPFSPIQYLPTPIKVESEAQLTTTEIVTPLEKKELPIATPARDEKAPELHVDEYK
ncbi:hypothetical protein PRIPAC_73211 [Pristionchus pacificus]|uniref:Uncharacterized protein n=1 Tax=Pristionchus pacificus TaxID=54126 RepID=A0A2A6CT30_PRIPA|nr:hypothetical protein PRIPAC_73211 [Pristionchus pacificus]|eukprot:PDM81193.1 hypothetical protein PRIPAC_36196 [Pristionchus pacificus]